MDQSTSSAATQQPVSHRTDLLVLGFIMIAGALAFLWAGYIGNPKSADRIIREPWALFGYFCLVMLALEALVLFTTAPRPSRARIITIMTVTCGWIILVSAVYLTGSGNLFTWIKERAPEIALWLNGNKQLVFNAANLLCIVILWLGIRLGSYDAPAATANERKEYPGERLVGDLLISTIFSIILSVVFFAPLWQSNNALAASGGHAQSSGTSLTVCDITFLPFATPCKLSTFDVSTIFMLDLLILPLIYLGIALGILLFSAYGEAVRQFRQRQQAGEDGAFPAFPAVFWQVVYDIVNRRWKQLPNLLRALRYVWPLLLLAAVILAGLAAKAIPWLLFNVAAASGGNVLWLPPTWNQLGSDVGLEFGAATAVLIAMAATTLAATIQGLERHTSKSDKTGKSETSGSAPEEMLSMGWSASWPHVRFLVVTLATSYWAFSLVFSIINGLALIGVREYGIVANVRPKDLQPLLWSPFIQPEPLMVVSLVIFVLASPQILKFLFSRSSSQANKGRAK